MVELNLDALRRIGVQPGLERARVHSCRAREAERRIDALLGEGPGAPFVHLHPASRWRFKCWTASRTPS